MGIATAPLVASILSQQLNRHTTNSMSPPPLVRIEEEESTTLPGYDTGGMLSEMFNSTSSTELLDYRAHRPTPGNTNEYSPDVAQQQHQQQLPSINADSAAAMHLISMNPHQRSPSPSPAPTTASTPNTLHMLLQNPSTSLQGFNVSGPGGAYGTSSVLSPPQFTWTHVVGNQGKSLSLSLSSSLQHLEAEELRIGDGGLMYYDQDQHQNHVGFESSSGMVSVLSNSKYIKAAQELLEEFCSVGRSGQFKKNKLGRIEQVRSKNKYINTNPNSNPGSGGCSSSINHLSASDRIEHQRKKVKLLSMLDQVERRYNHYCTEEMQMVVNSFDLVMGYGAAVPYTALAQKAMSRHFRCLKDAISAQLRHSCEMLGERDRAGSSGITKGETPRLRVLEQSLRHQRVFHQMGGMMEQEAWRRPQRGLPGRSVNILRAWLFDHFVNPYPSDADKHLLARQTGLSRNQVSNWFINARVRLWKPMVEDMYQQETRQHEEPNSNDNNTHRERNTNNKNTQTSTPSTKATTAGKRYQLNATENDPSINTTQCFSGNQTTEVAPPISQPTTTHDSDNHQRIAGIEDHRTTSTCDIGSTVVMLGTTAGDVSLTLGLLHAGNMPENTSFNLRTSGDVN